MSSVTKTSVKVVNKVKARVLQRHFSGLTEDIKWEYDNPLLYKKFVGLRGTGFCSFLSH